MINIILTKFVILRKMRKMGWGSNTKGASTILVLSRSLVGRWVQEYYFIIENRDWMRHRR